jgi:adenylate cyclase
MKRDGTRYIYYLIGVIGVLLLLLISYSRVFDEFEYSTFDFRFRTRPLQPVGDDIVIIHIGDDTIEKIGEWPIPRKYHALLIKALKEANVKTVVFDVFFSEKSEHDQGFAKEVKDAGNVYMADVFEIDFSDPDKKMYHADRYLAPLIDPLEEAAKAVGFINVVPDIDGKVRRVIPFIEYQGKLYPHVTVLAAVNDLGYSWDDLGFFPEDKIVGRDGLVMPLLDHSTLLVNYPGEWGRCFRHYSYIDIVQSHLSGLLGQKPVIDLKDLEGTVCFIGFTATASPDAHPSPLEPLYPGVGVHASIYNNIMKNSFLTRANRRWNLLVLMILWAVTAVVTVKSRKRFAFLSIIFVFVAYVAFAEFIFWLASVWVDMVYPLVTMMGLYILITFKKYLDEIEKREILERELTIAKEIQESFLPKDIPSVGNIEIAARMLTAEQVGGDLYDIVQLDSSRVGVMLGDVSGKGVPAALFMAQVVSIFKSFAREGSAAQVVSKMNERLVTEGRSNLFVTLTYMIFDSAGEKTNFAVGGHLPTVLVEPDGNVKLLSSEEGMPLGLIEGGFSEGDYTFKPGSVFILYTDGVTEAMNTRNEMFGEERLIKLAGGLAGRSAAEVVGAIHSAVTAFAGKAAQHDDITVVAVRT